MSKCDLHIHSRYSNRPSEWLLRRLGAPESFVEPLNLYETCKARGMDYITITDHNSICGALDIAHMRGVFLSSEITTYFPEDRCKIHCLTIGITESQFEQIQKTRENIYELQQYLHQNNIIHSIAHPLFSINDKLAIEHIEKLILLFKRFETLNGAHNHYQNTLAKALLQNLKPDTIDKIANRHNIKPVSDRPWEKFFTAGSDDHSGLYSAQAYTSTEKTSNICDFLQHLREGKHTDAGSSGSSLKLAHTIYRIAYNYYCNKFSTSKKFDPLGKMLERLAGVEPSRKTKKIFVPQPIARFFKSRKKKKLGDIEKLLIDEFQSFSKIKHLHSPGSDEHSFHLASSIGHAITFTFTQQFIRNIEKGRLVDSIQSISSILPIILGLAPYLTAFAAQHKDKKLLKNVERHFHIISEKPLRAAWFTDTFDDINGVSNTIHTVAKIAKQKSQDITVVTSLKEKPLTDFPVQNFQPIGIFDLPEYESQKVAFPPFLNIIEFIENQQFNQIIISTPGPVGLVGLLAAKLLNINLKGMYHTDFPQYVRHLTDDDYMEEIAWKYVLWFYGCMEKVLVPSRSYFEQLESRGIEQAKIDVLSRGVDGVRFNPTKRDVKFWDRYNINGGFKFLYVGRVSVEKNLENLLTAFYIVKQKIPLANLVIVGEGPSFETFKSRFKHSDIVWTGYLTGEELSCVYASSDVFVFPSMTDTFGNVVLEAHSSGLPAIVSDKGGPAEIVRTHNSGLVVDARLPSNIAQAMEQIYGDELLRMQLKNNALKKAQESGWDEVLNKLIQR